MQVTLLHLFGQGQIVQRCTFGSVLQDSRESFGRQPTGNRRVPNLPNTGHLGGGQLCSELVELDRPTVLIDNA
ncbi:hypothetical protein D3C84_707280 [compost metagenome]